MLKLVFKIIGWILNLYLVLAYSLTILIPVALIATGPHEYHKHSKHRSKAKSSGYWFDSKGPHLKPFIYNPKEEHVITELKA